MPADASLHPRDQRLVVLPVTAAHRPTARLVTAKRLARRQTQRFANEADRQRSFRYRWPRRGWQPVKCVDQSKRGASDGHTACAR